MTTEEINVGTLTDKDVETITDFLERADLDEFAHVFGIVRDTIGHEALIGTLLDLVSDTAEFMVPYFREYAQVGKLALKGRQIEENRF